LDIAAWHRPVVPGSEPNCDSSAVPVVRPRLPNVVALEGLDLFVSGRRCPRGALPKAHSVVLGSSHRYLVCRGGRGDGGSLDLIVHRRTIGSVRWSGVGDRDYRSGVGFFIVRSHHGYICVSAGEFPADDGVSRTPGNSRRSQTAVLNEQAAEKLSEHAGTSQTCA